MKVVQLKSSPSLECTKKCSALLANVLTAAAVQPECKLSESSSLLLHDVSGININRCEAFLCVFSLCRYRGFAQRKRHLQMLREILFAKQNAAATKLNGVARSYLSRIHHLRKTISWAQEVGVNCWIIEIS